MSYLLCGKAYCMNYEIIPICMEGFLEVFMVVCF